MTDKIEGIPNTGDQRRSHSIIPDEFDDYVIGGAELSYASGPDRLLVSSGRLTIADGDVVYGIELDERSITGPASGDIYFDLQPGSPPSGDVVIGSQPSAPRLKLGSVDPNAGTTSVVNRRPNLAAQSLSAEDIYGPGGQGSADAVAFEAVETGQASVANETFVRGQRGSATSTIASGTYVNIFDGASKDVRGEFNGNAEFAPDKSGEYLVNVVPDIRNNSAGDTLSFRIYNTSVSKTVGSIARAEATGTADTPVFTRVVRLTEGDSYELQITNNDSSYSVETVSSGVILRSVVS